MSEYTPSEGFPVQLDDGSTVRIVEKKPDPQIGTVLIDENGVAYQDDYNTLDPAYVVEEAPEEEVIPDQAPPTGSSVPKLWER